MTSASSYEIAGERTRRIGGRSLGVLRLGWAAVLLVAPQKVVALLGGEPTKEGLAVARVLGVRHLLQGLCEVAWWPTGRRLGCAVDLAHALSGAVVALPDTAWRRPALTDAAIATSFAAAGWLAGSSPH